MAMVRVSKLLGSNINPKPNSNSGVGWDSFHLFSNIAENIYDRDFDFT